MKREDYISSITQALNTLDLKALRFVWFYIFGGSRGKRGETA